MVVIVDMTLMMLMMVMTGCVGSGTGIAAGDSVSGFRSSLVSDCAQTSNHLTEIPLEPSTFHWFGGCDRASTRRLRRTQVRPAGERCNYSGVAASHSNASLAAWAHSAAVLKEGCTATEADMQSQQELLEL